MSAGWLLGEPDTEQAVAAMAHAVHLGHWQAPLRLAEWHHRGAQGLEVSRASIVSMPSKGELVIYRSAIILQVSRLSSCEHAMYW